MQFNTISRLNSLGSCLPKYQKDYALPMMFVHFSPEDVEFWGFFYQEQQGNSFYLAVSQS